MYSNPPKHGAAIVATILNDPALLAQWKVGRGAGAGGRGRGRGRRGGTGARAGQGRARRVEGVSGRAQG